jgi:hypothetical protein
MAGTTLFGTSFLTGGKKKKGYNGGNLYTDSQVQLEIGNDE